MLIHQMFGTRMSDTLTLRTTNKNGEAVIKDLPLGKYRVKETKTPAGFVLNPDSQEVSFIY
ncbi:prealbumin-like fold domain-containing protein, partial [Blautia sp. MSK.21.1]|uniref:prealbumin-like fold domain-containing protein n=1 Tax=Blautia sp. MSK.21.1 TaxID=2742763 RepID=UPI002ED3BC1E